MVLAAHRPPDPLLFSRFSRLSPPHRDAPDMPVEVFSAQQPWGAAARHQRDHPTAWTPQLVETTAAWTDVVRAVVQSQEELVATAGSSPPSFVRRCAEDATLRAQLDLLCERQMHGLLLAWLIEGVRERLANHAVPSFWRHYREAPGPPAGARSSAAVQRRCQAAFFAAVHELGAYVSAQLAIVGLLEGRGWHAASSAASAAAGGAACPPASPATLCDEVLTLLQALVLAQAPAPEAFANWLTACWHRSAGTLARGGESASGGGGGEEGGEGGEEGEEGEGDDDDWLGDGGDEGDEAMGVVVGAHEAMGVESPQCSAVSVQSSAVSMAVVDAPSADTALRACCEQLHRLRWLPLVEPTLSAMLHQRLHAALLRTCAKRFDTPCLQRVLSRVHTGVARWLRAVLMPSAADDEPASAEMTQWLARLQFFLRQSLGSLRICELFDLIVDYPDSMPAILDLKECLIHTHQHADAVAVLAEAIELRLLMPGADTANIIEVYVSAIKALRQLDPSGVTLEAVSERVRTWMLLIAS